MYPCLCTAFTPEGDLIGVAGITLYLELMGNLTNPVKNALQSRVTGYSAPTKPIILTAANCTVVVIDHLKNLAAQICHIGDFFGSEPKGT